MLDLVVFGMSKPYGVVKVTHDPSDLGPDPKAVCVRKGNVITNVVQRSDIDVNEGSDWALGIAINEGADRLCICDTVGGVTPTAVKNIFEWYKSISNKNLLNLLKKKTNCNILGFFLTFKPSTSSFTDII